MLQAGGKVSLTPPRLPPAPFPSGKQARPAKKVGMAAGTECATHGP
jgi:hypothetical protein